LKKVLDLFSKIGYVAYMMNERKNDMITTNIWTALATFGNARVSDATVFAAAVDWNVADEVARRWIRNQLNSEAASEGVSLRINTLPDGRLDIYLRKFS
jgi:hypothetical protein